ncbi:SAP domain-containing protein [Deferribacter abyssi]|uniref:SAP domain-containing protein n=1 Tax=Deferribacter abyssi TaxID=213806 RepID=UPI003C143973
MSWFIIFIVVLIIIYFVLEKITDSTNKPTNKVTRSNTYKTKNFTGFDESAFYTSKGNFRFPKYNINNPIRIRDISDYKEIKEGLRYDEIKIKSIEEFNEFFPYYDLLFEVESVVECFQRLKNHFSKDLEWAEKLHTDMLDDLFYFCEEDDDNVIEFDEHSEWYDVLKNTDFIKEIKCTKEEYLSSLLVNDLKEICKANNLKVSGKKNELIQRILDANVDIKIPKHYEITRDICSEVIKIFDFYLNTVEELIKDFHPFYKYAIWKGVYDSSEYNYITNKVNEKIKELEKIIEG